MLSMNDTNEILTFLGLPREQIQSISVTSDENKALVLIELADLRTKCPHCSSTNIGIKGYFSATINNSITKHKQMTVIVRVRKYKCRDCGHTFKQDYRLYKKGCSISNETKYQIVEALKTNKTFKEIAEQFGVSTMTVIRTLDDAVKFQKRKPLPKVLCIDEFCFKHTSGQGKYPAVLSDGLTGEIIDIVVSRRKEYLHHYFNHIAFGERKNVKYFVSDMNMSYREIQRRFFPDSLYVIDLFHVMKLFNNAVREIRTRIMTSNEYRSKEYLFLKKHWKFFQMHQDKLRTFRKINKRTGEVTDWQLELNYVLRKYNDLNYAYSLKENFYFKTRRLLRYKEALNLVDFVILNCEASLVPEMKAVGKAFQNWKYSITNALAINEFKKRISNAVAEANNNVIETLINASFGLVNFERLRKRILFISNSKKTR